MSLVFKKPLIFKKPVSISMGLTPSKIAGVSPSLDYRFAKDRSNIDAVTLTNKLAITTVDADGSFINQSKQLQNATVNTPRFTHNASTGLSEGLHIENTSTNEIRNSRGIGAVVGFPGTAPTNWNITTSYNRRIVDKGIEDGIPYVDVRFFVPTSASFSLLRLIDFDSVTLVPAAAGEIWTSSCYIRLMSGSFQNITFAALRTSEFNSSGTALTSTSTDILTATNAPLITQRFARLRTVSAPTVAYIMTSLTFSSTGAGSIDFTLRLGLPQLEKGISVPTTAIPTSSAAVTRSGESIKIQAGPSVITGNYTMIDKPSGSATVSGTDILLNPGTNGTKIERVMVFPASLSAQQITDIRAAM
jgi:hypothetical protein